jgi:hypothetical protein
VPAGPTAPAIDPKNEPPAAAVSVDAWQAMRFADWRLRARSRPLHKGQIAEESEESDG